MNDIAVENNDLLKEKSEIFYSLLSDFGKNIYMPRGIISQTQEAKKFAKKYDATIGIAKEHGSPMYLKSISKYFNDLEPKEIFPYASPYGVPALRKIWRNKILNENSAIKSEDSVSMPVVTQALTNGLMLTGDLFINEGDEILIPNKLWGNYRLIFEVRYKAKIVNYSFFNEPLTGFDIDALDKVLSESKKEKIVLLFNFPNNPTGYAPTSDEVKQIVEVVKKYADKGKKILIISDDAYYGLFYENNIDKGSIFSKFAGIHKNIAAVKIDGYTKEYYVWGFRVGFITYADFGHDKDVYRVLEDKTAAAIRCSISNCSNTKQSILIKLNDDTNYKEEKQEKFNILKERYDKVNEVVHNQKYADCWDVYPFNSGYFMCLRIKGINANDLRQHLLQQYQVGTISIGATDLRVAFSCVDLEQIEDIFSVIAKAVRELRENK